MFQFRGLARLSARYDSIVPGCPIRTSADQLVFANPRGFSQLTTSFLAFESLGIPHLLFLTFSTATAPFAKLLRTLSHSLIMSMNSYDLPKAAFVTIATSVLYCLSRIVLSESPCGE